MPRSVAALEAPPARSAISSVSVSTNGAAAATRGFSSACCRIAGQSASPSPKAVIVACEVRLRMRERSSCSKPFMTDSTTISTATPIATPTIEISEMNDRKRLPVERR